MPAFENIWVHECCWFHFDLLISTQNDRSICGNSLDINGNTTEYVVYLIFLAFYINKTLNAKQTAVPDASNVLQ